MQWESRLTWHKPSQAMPTKTRRVSLGYNRTQDVDHRETWSLATGRQLALPSMLQNTRSWSGTLLYTWHQKQQQNTTFTMIHTAYILTYNSQNVGCIFCQKNASVNLAWPWPLTLASKLWWHIGICHNMCLPSLVKIRRLVLELSRQNGFP